MGKAYHIFPDGTSHKLGITFGTGRAPVWLIMYKRPAAQPSRLALLGQPSPGNLPPATLLPKRPDNFHIGWEAFKSTETVSDAISDWRRVGDDTVVARDRAGTPVSLFKDDAWNDTAFDVVTAHRYIHFRDLVPGGVLSRIDWATKVQVKQVMYFMMYETVDDVPAVETIKTKKFVLSGHTYQYEG